MSSREELDKIKLNMGLNTDKELAESIKTTKSNIDSWVKRNNIPEKWRLKIGQISPSEIPLPSKIINIPHYDNVVASAGGGAYALDDNTSIMSFDTEFLRVRLGVSNNKNMHTITASGDSMQPTINNGDLLFVLPFENESKTIKDGAIYVLNCDSAIFVKRVRTNPVNKTITLVSDNKDYEPIIFRGDELDMCNIVGRVVVYMGMA